MRKARKEMLQWMTLDATKAQKKDADERMTIILLRLHNRLLLFLYLESPPCLQDLLLFKRRQYKINHIESYFAKKHQRF